MLFTSFRAPHSSSCKGTGATSTASPHPLLHRSPLHRHHASRPSTLSWPQRTHSHPSTRLVSCQAKRTSSSFKGGGGKKGGSSDGGFSLSNIDKLLAERPELQVGGQSNSSGGRSYAPTNVNPGPFKKPSLLESLDNVEAAASPTPVATADMLYQLGDATNREAKYRQLGSMEQTRVAAAMAKLSDLLLGEHGSSKRIEQLDGKHLSLSAWGTGKVGSKGIRVSARLGDAFAECALACPSMDGPKVKGWLNWANLLYGLAEAGMVCSSSKHVHAAFDAAVHDRLHACGQPTSGQSVSNVLWATVTAGYDGNLEPLVSAVAGGLSMVKDANAQHWSNTIWALAKHEERKAGRLGQGKPIILQKGLAVMLDLAAKGAVVPQDVSNILWALPKLKWKTDVDVVGELASALTRKASSANEQALANALWGMSELGWYDASTYTALMSALASLVSSARSQALSNALVACAEAQHWDSSMERLAEYIRKQSEQQWSLWEEQHICNALHSWAVLRATGAAPASPGFVGMAQQLFAQAARMGTSFIDAHFCQLFLATQVANHEGLAGSGLSASQVQVCAESYEASQLVLSQKTRRTDFLEKKVAAALEHAGYHVESAVIAGTEFVHLRAQGVAVMVAAGADYFCFPSGLLRGSLALHVILAARSCKGSFVISDAEWASLKDDSRQQQALLVQHLQQALSKG